MEGRYRNSSSQQNMENRNSRNTQDTSFQRLNRNRLEKENEREQIYEPSSSIHSNINQQQNSQMYEPEMSSNPLANSVGVYTNSSSSSFLSQMNNASSVIVNGVKEYMSIEQIKTTLMKFGQLLSLKPIKMRNSNKIKYLATFQNERTAKDIMAVGLIRFGQKVLKISDPKKLVRRENQNLSFLAEDPQLATVWGPNGATEIARYHIAENNDRPEASQGTRADLDSIERQSEVLFNQTRGIYSPSAQETYSMPFRDVTVGNHQPGHFNPQKEEETDTYDIEVEQEIVTTYRIKFRGVVYQQVVQSSDGWVTETPGFPADLLRRANKVIHINNSN